MKPELHKFAPAGLFLSLAGLIAAGIFAILNRSFSLPVQISLAVVVVGLALFALLDPTRTREMLTGRQARYGSNALILTVAVIGILVVANIGVSNISKTWDLTEDKRNTLAKESIDAVKSMKSPVKAEAYFTSRIPTDTTRTLLDNYKNASGGKFTYEFVDPETNPVRANTAKVTKDGTIVLIENGHSELVTNAAEQDVTNALIRVDNPGNRKAYFLIGHDEYSPDGSNGRTIQYAKQVLSSKNYGIASLNLLAERKIPDDATALVIAGPMKPLSQDEVNLISAYLQKGGGLVLLSEPPIVTQFGDQPDLLAAYLKTAYGITLGDNLVIDTNYNPPVVAVEASYGTHPITDKMGNQVTIFPTARSVQADPSPSPEVATNILVSTSQNSWGENDKTQLQNNSVKFDAGKDLAGPISIGLAAENSTNKSRVVVFGDSDFASDQYFTQYGNGDLLMNAIDWAAKQDTLINLSTKQSTTRVISLNNNITAGLVLIISVFVIPALVIIGGIVVWVRRRRKG